MRSFTWLLIAIAIGLVVNVAIGICTALLALLNLFTRKEANDG